MTLVTLGAENWPEPTEQPVDRGTLGEYDVDPAILTRWRDARREYLSVRAKLVGAIERQGWRAPATSTSSYIDVVFTGAPGGPDEPPAQFVEVEDDHGNRIRLGEWMRRDDGRWVLRLPRGEATR